MKSILFDVISFIIYNNSSDTFIFDRLLTIRKIFFFFAYFKYSDKADLELIESSAIVLIEDSVIIYSAKAL